MLSSSLYGITEQRCRCWREAAKKPRACDQPVDVTANWVYGDVGEDKGPNKAERSLEKKPIETIRIV